MKEWLDSITEVVRNRATNSLYGTFVISWAVFHWKFIISLLFLSEEKIWDVTGLLKTDYLSKLLFNSSDWYFYVSWIAPFLLTWIIIWKLPQWILVKAYKETEKYETEKQLIKICTSPLSSDTILVS